MADTADLRDGEYARRGDYHLAPDGQWDYRPTYLAKMRWVRRVLDGLPASTAVLDIGCGEGVLVAEFRDRLAIEGVDANYASEFVRRGSALELPFPNGGFEVALCLDVLEHLQYDEQPRALAEMRRVLKPGGVALFSFPNLAHLQSRVHFALTGRLMRTSNPRKHPGDRPIREYLAMLADAGFLVTARHGVFPTVPVLTHLVRRHPSRLGWLHDALTRLLPLPGWCFLNLVTAKVVLPAGAADTNPAQDRG